IFNNYGYMLAENQSVWFLEKFPGLHLNLNLFKFGFWLTALSFFVPLFRKKWKEIEVSNVLFFVGFGGMAWLAERNFALFGFFMIPVLVSNLSGFFESLEPLEKKIVNGIAVVALVLAICVTLFGGLTRYFPYWSEGGLGLQTHNSLPMDFWKKEGLQGPIFNNYDIGGYLIYHLYPQEKVFVDNRPEAYPAEFFQKVYIPMQDDVVWKEQLAVHNFNAIVFSYHDMTPWGQQFLIARTRDPLWVPVFVDNQVLMLLKNNETNKSVIEKFSLKLF
ncbi:MAG: hypothetical protein NUV54_03390, partial [Candidatus Taylorbacteria bacterium]|nr:hypothetical protein [Candidatus Taylorbacteria bacterium]